MYRQVFMKLPYWLHAYSDTDSASHRIITSSHHRIIISSYHHIIASSHHRIIISSHHQLHNGIVTNTFKDIVICTREDPFLIDLSPFLGGFTSELADKGAGIGPDQHVSIVDWAAPACKWCESVMRQLFFT
jgi:hypothetical protein